MHSLKSAYDRTSNPYVRDNRTAPTSHLPGATGFIGSNIVAELIKSGHQVFGLAQEEAQSYFGPLAMFVGADLSASSLKTRQRLEWRPTGPGLIQDLEQKQYS